MKSTKELLGARIKEIRKIRGLSQDELSEKIDIDPKHLRDLEFSIIPFNYNLSFRTK